MIKERPSLIYGMCTERIGAITPTFCRTCWVIESNGSGAWDEVLCHPYIIDN